ncbi:histidine N-acetyltransferase-like [Ruditapes philippinarum]|uniref:histidine N-acetyltransferase-like n=1 Tax=Ruditapes philippinarum TaxID=129788 RepID=UPI00295A67CA|nr:histidine N-acetyltransferase-like [Ruditapes philippinarum]
MNYVYRIRESTPEDKQAVLEIHKNVYDGLDYLPEYYDHFQTSDHVTSYVYMENDEIIAYLACSVVDNGETIVTRAGRVSPSRQGRHLYGHFISEIETVHRAGGKTKRHALVKITTPSNSFLKFYKPVAAKAIHMYEYANSVVSIKTAEFISKFSKLNSHAKTFETFPVEFLQYPYSKYLFPEERIIVDWVPFRLSSTNVPLLKGRDTVFYSDITSETAKVDDLKNEHTDDTGRIQGLLSACTIFKAQQKFDLSCNLDIFGLDFRTIENHMIFHLQRINDTGMDNVNLRVYTSKTACDISLLHSTLEQFGIQAVTNRTREEQYIEQVVYEKDISI